MKRSLLKFLAVTMSLITLTGCAQTKSNETVEAKDLSTIVIWHDKEDAVGDVLETKLKELAPDINVVLEKKSDLTESLKMVGNDPKAAPDMYIFAHDKLGVYAEMGILADINDIVPEDKFADYIPATLDAAKYKGTMYQLPMYYETLLFVYNKKFMSEADVPNTTEELYKYMKDNTKDGHYGFVEQHSTPYYAAGWLNGFGASLLSNDGTPGLNSSEVIKGLDYHKKFVELMPGETEYSTVDTLFNEGMADSTIGGPWIIPSVRESGMDVGVAPMPVIDESGKPITPFMGVQGIQVLKYAAENKKDSVEKILTALMEPEVEVELAKASGCAPARNKCYENDEIKSDEVVMTMKETAENVVPMPNIPEMDVMWSVMSDLMTDVNMSGKDTAESAEKAQKSAEQLIAGMK